MPQTLDPELKISFKSLSVGSMSASSGVFNGTNRQFGWSSHSKANSGLGSIGGEKHEIVRNINMVMDNDHLDTPIDDRDIMWDQPGFPKN
ncbi:hypothetical protein JOD45_003027 [Scopulibacillus daqui]|uniref:Uncharacterized protein n=1 Tax=Scopulibacillus daqui TaxID=1469162 RepID=A0ABS2Q3I5_9BACL|nr:hypothetical protein [Scopulibacillus daqui]MBM7646793.1 hypothetical protein [Scopulibacillus daqui]